MTVEQMAATMTAREYRDWSLFYEMEYEEQARAMDRARRGAGPR
jgi:hypothetical protein